MGANSPVLTKDAWPAHIADALGIDAVEGSHGPWVSVGGTTISEWFEAVAVRLGVQSMASTKSDRMRELLAFVGVTWDAPRHSSDETVSHGGGNIRREAFEDFFAGLVSTGLVSGQSKMYKRLPPWSWDEQFLAFELYLDVGYQDNSNARVRELSRLLRSAGIHVGQAGNPSFRSPSSVARKLSDIHTHRPGYEGKPTSGSKLDDAMWLQFGVDPDRAEISRIADDIRRSLVGEYPAVDDEQEYHAVHAEGVVRYRMHRSLERDSRLRARKLDQERKSNDGQLACEACGLNPSRMYGKRFAETLDCHHLVPLHESGPQLTSLKDVALLCPTCHRVAHMIKPSPSLGMLKAVATSQQPLPGVS